MLKIYNCTAGYEKKTVLHNITFSLTSGKITALLGPNGCGKSTLLKVLSRIIPYRSGSISLDGRDIKSFSKNELAKTIAYLPQITTSLPHCTVFDSILLGRNPYIRSNISNEDLSVTVQVIEKFKLETFSFRLINKLSGGEVQKVLIARAIAQNPKILLLDEPINHLDMKNQIEILKLIKELTSTMNLATLVVLHDINRALQFCDEFILLKEGKIFKTGDKQIITPCAIKKVYDITSKAISINSRKIIIS